MVTSRAAPTTATTTAAASIPLPSEPFLNKLEVGSYRYVARLSSNPRLERWTHVDRIADKAKPEDRTHTVDLS